jgi:hypothetical protein
VRAILGCLLMVSGASIGAEEFLFENNNLLVATAFAGVGIGIVLLLRRPNTAIDLRDDASCRTCRGAGTVYTAEYNDWRQTGPIKTIRELCPTCEGLAR